MNGKYLTLHCALVIGISAYAGAALSQEADVAQIKEFQELQGAIQELSDQAAAILLSTPDAAATVYENLSETVAATEALQRAITDKPVYIWDDRKNYYEVSEHERKAAEATAVMVQTDDLLKASDESYTLPDRRLALCPGERFRTEPAPGMCSSFRIGPDLVATAGHCVQTSEECSSRSFIFGFNMDTASDQPNRNIDASQIYQCRELVRGVLDPVTGEDWRVVRLDRTISSAIPTVELRAGPSVEKNDNVTIIGYPSGLPVKVARNGIVRDLGSLTFEATLDAFGGNSGSVVIRTDSLDNGKLIAEGILVRGEDDYDVEQGCIKAKICEADECSGEDVTFSHLAME